VANGVGRAPTTYVEDEERLYRLVQPKYVQWTEVGPRIGVNAFLAVNWRVSVDRAELCGHDPSHTQVDSMDYVCSMLTSDVRATSTVWSGPSKGVSAPTKYEIDVEHVPEHDNHAHAEIYGNPPISRRKPFSKLKERLALISEWELGFRP
jgi:hypothetical protein